MMPRRKREQKGELFDPTSLRLIVFIFIAGIVLGFFFGRRFTLTSKVSERPSEINKEVKEPQKKQKGVFPFLPAGSSRPATKGKIAIVIDDVGNDQHFQDLLWSFPHPVTLAILPELPYSEYFAREGARHGFEIILHQPMEPVRRFGRDDPGMIYVSMTEAQVIQTLMKNLRTVPTAVGINNHKGSLATQNQNVMRIILKELKQRHLFFLDSLTTPLTIAREETQAIHLPYLARDVFLDNELEADYIHGQIEELASLAKRNGSAIGIGHFKQGTLSILKEEIVRLEQDGFEVVFLGELL
ncbi:MAG: divergent polysaccharide deacetylase family protein [Candidatus Omnitrophica bacterium]|nr:divergent polysaccharide deacetylase family protein [Candidatus Omnitrophota bacterium]